MLQGVASEAIRLAPRGSHRLQKRVATEALQAPVLGAISKINDQDPPAPAPFNANAGPISRAHEKLLSGRSLTRDGVCCNTLARGRAIARQAQTEYASDV